MIVIGIHNTGINSSASLVIDGELKYAFLEERLSRKKYDKSFPHNAIQKILELSNLEIKDVDCFAIGWNPAINVGDRYRAGFSEWSGYAGNRFSSNPNNILPLLEQEYTNTEQIFHTRTNKKIKIEYVSHHLSHALTSFIGSGFKKSAILTCDGYGEKATTAWYIGNSNKVDLIGEINFPHSIGMFYSTLTEYLGFRPNLDEWKVMGASAYGKKNLYLNKIRKLIKKTGLNFELNLEYFQFYNFDSRSMFTHELIKLLGPSRKKNDEMEQRHYDIAASIQAVTEEFFINAILELKKQTNLHNLCLSGGSVMNSVANGLIEQKNIFENVHIPYAPDDSGNSIGAALSISSNFKRKNTLNSVFNPFLGAKYSDEEIAKQFKLTKLTPQKLNEKELIDLTVDLLMKGKIIGWFQGRMEFGQRALGNRSIIADPRNNNMKDLINSAIKFREGFRPFAPSILEEFANEWFISNSDIKSTYMEKVYTIKEKLKHLVPSIVHFDNSCRVQTVNQKLSPLFYKLINEFYKETKIPMLLNTSFNVNNEPIVESPGDAIKTFYSSGLDVLIIGNYVLFKS